MLAKTPGFGQEFLLNFNAVEGPALPGGTTRNGAYEGVNTDGDDKIFGGIGNDWLVGGTGRDDLYGGWGNDLLNADDEQGTNGGVNDRPDTHPSYEDRAYGGAGRDYLIANTGGDRLIDWAGEMNSYLVPFAPFGLATVSRSVQPALIDFLYQLSASDGADATRAADARTDAARNGEPEGELGLVIQHDDAWQDQTGGPADPQAGS
jgi:Ca2+-binding RTX toxin-like protein